MALKDYKPIKLPKLKKDTLKNITMGAIIFLIIAVYSLYDIYSLKFEIDLILTADYWASVGLQTFLVVLFMLTVRQQRKFHIINKPDIVKDEDKKKIIKPNQFEIYMNNLNAGYNNVISNGLSDKLDEYLLKLNKEKKYKLFCNRNRNRLTFIKERLKPGDREKPRNKIIKKLIEHEKKLKELLMLTEEEVWQLNFKFEKVTVSKLFSSINGKTIDDDETNIDPKERESIRNMITNKVLWVIIFGAFTGSLIPSFFTGLGWMVAVSIILKIITLMMAANMAMVTADDYVNINLKTSLQRRLRILADFKKLNNLENVDLEEKK